MSMDQLKIVILLSVSFLLSIYQVKIKGIMGEKTVALILSALPGDSY